MSAEADFVAALIAALRADAGVRAVLGDDARVFDDWPAGAAFPYARVDSGAAYPADAAEVAALEHEVAIEVRARHGGKREMLDILAALRAALDNRPMAIAGRRLVLLSVVSAQALRADEQTMRGLIRLRAITEQE